MRCIRCGKKDTKVTDSRNSSFANEVRRRRLCARCGYRFSTVEKLETLSANVKKNDGSTEPYSKEKVIEGMKRALKKCDVSKDRFMRLTASVQKEIDLAIKDEVISSKEIGSLVSQKLRNFDKVAYLRFVSVHRAFQDVKSFEEELFRLKKRKKESEDSRKEKTRNSMVRNFSKE